MNHVLSFFVPPTIAAVVCTACLAADFRQRDLLAGNHSLAWVRSNLMDHGAFKPYPTANDRKAWQSLPAPIRDAIIQRGEALLDKPWESLPASIYLEYARNGNREGYQRLVFGRRNNLRDLTLAECVEGKGRFLDQIVNGLWLTCEESAWPIPAHIGAQKAGTGLPDVTEPTIDLFAGETSAQLAWTLYLLGPQLDKVSPLVNKRIAEEIDRRILTPYLQRDDFWWMGLGARKDMNNWTPWIVSNVLPSGLIIEKDADRRAQIVYKSLRIVDAFLNVYPDDGSCDEGPSYWDRAGGSLFDCLTTLHAVTGGRIDLSADPMILNIARYIGRVHIAGPWYVNFGDASARPKPNGPLIYRFGRYLHDPETMRFGAWLAHESKSDERAPAGSLDRILADLFDTGPIDGANARPALSRDVWLPDLQMMTARDRDGADDGFFVAAMGGHNAQSHNHNDVGSFLVAYNGQPLLIDVGVETYTRKTFSKDRYDIWTMQSAYHNLPTINGVMQAAGREFAARDVRYHADDTAAQISMDIAPAYPAQAKVNRWQRQIRLVRGQQISIIETFELSDVSSSIVLNLMTASAVDASKPGVLSVEADSKHAIDLTYDAAQLKPHVEQISIEDARLKPVWGSMVRRIQLTATRSVSAGSLELTIKPH